MRSLPKPLIGLLLSTVVFFALWMVALKPSSSTSGGSPDGVGQYQSAINKAHQAVKTSNAANAKLGAPTSTGVAPKSPTTSKAVTASPVKVKPVARPAVKAAAKPAVKTSAARHAAAKPASPSVASEVKALQTAVADHDVVAILFYNPSAADDQAMKTELASVPTDHGQVVKLAIPVSELTKFEMVTTQVPVVTAPTLVVIDRTRQATTLTGFASQLEINQRVADALATK